MSALHLTKGYWQVPLTPEAWEKTAFATPDRLFHYRKLPFGLHRAPPTFQRLMDQVLRPHRVYATAYIDDTVIHGSEWDTHLKQVSAVLQALREAGLTANPKKGWLGPPEASTWATPLGGDARNPP